MASITIRNLDDEVKARLRVRAASNGRSVEEEVRLILRDAVGSKPGSRNLVSISARTLGRPTVWTWSCHPVSLRVSYRPSSEPVAMQRACPGKA